MNEEMKEEEKHSDESTYQSKELCVVQRFDQQHTIEDHQSWSTHLTQEDRIETWIRSVLGDWWALTDKTRFSGT